MTKLHILCLHGYRQNALKLRGRIAAFRRAFRSSVEFGLSVLSIAMNGCAHVHRWIVRQCASTLRLKCHMNLHRTYKPMSKNLLGKRYQPALMCDLGGSEEIGENVKQLKWFDFTRDNETGPNILSLVDAAIDYVANFVKNEGPFDGIFGFSQGGSMASLILQRQVNTLDSPFLFRFALFVSAGAVDDPKYRSDKKVQMPSLHIIGETDRVVPKDSSLVLKDMFINPTVLMHPGGHYIPTNKERKDALRAFFEKRRTDV
ncbi:hypothetical protein CCR75_006473 [Bremia lactucae]|uniref:Serine hydrolase domain-containing protein n=1 Tax=Bremia lactucae TaxID=4779 RepID=A0A976FH80_BRELC|nr:hypothetical protein CCR75_006473 [Bremia lactucae]